MLKKRSCSVALVIALSMGMTPMMAEARTVRGARTAQVTSSSWQAALRVAAQWFGAFSLLQEDPKNGCIIDPNGVPLCGVGENPQTAEPEEPPVESGN